MSTKQLKVIILGNPAVGKTSIRKRYFGAGFNTSHLATIGADFAVKSLNLPEGKVNVQIWDLAGQGGFSNIRKRFYLGADCAILVYDVTSLESFQSLSKWLQEFWTQIESRLIPLLIIGNKTDLKSNIVVQEDHIQKYMDYLTTHPSLQNVPIHFIKTSAKNGINIKEAFALIINETLKFKTRKILETFDK